MLCIFSDTGPKIYRVNLIPFLVRASTRALPEFVIFALAFGLNSRGVDRHELSRLAPYQAELSRLANDAKRVRLAPPKMNVFIEAVPNSLLLEPVPD